MTVLSGRSVDYDPERSLATTPELVSFEEYLIEARQEMIVSYRPIAVTDHDFCIRVHHLSMRAYVEPLWGWNEPLQDNWRLNFQIIKKLVMKSPS